MTSAAASAKEYVKETVTVAAAPVMAAKVSAKAAQAEMATAPSSSATISMKATEPSMEEMLARLANHPNSSGHGKASAAASTRPTSKGFAAATSGASTTSTAAPQKAVKHSLTPAQVQEMMDNFGNKAYQAPSSGLEDPGTANICIGCE